MFSLRLNGEGRCMPVWGLPPLDPVVHAALEREYRTSTNRQLRQSSHIVLLAYQLATQAQVAEVVRCSPQTVWRVLARFREGGPAALARRPSQQSYQKSVTPAWKAALVQAMEQGPVRCGVPRPTWTAPLLADYLAERTGVQVSERTVRRSLRQLNYRLGRPTYTMQPKAEAQPDYHPKAPGSTRS
jgi:transposase